jgi:hypothetical protein
MTRHIFAAVRPRKRIPEVGDLVRGRGQPGHANIVLAVSAEHYDEILKRHFVYIRSVRYGKINSGNFQLIKGERSRSFKYYIAQKNDEYRWYLMAWEVIEDFAAVDNAALRASIVKSMEGVDTTWKDPTHEDEESDEDGDDDGDD